MWLLRAESISCAAWIAGRFQCATPARRSVPHLVAPTVPVPRQHFIRPVQSRGSRRCVAVASSVGGGRTSEIGRYVNQETPLVISIDHQKKGGIMRTICALVIGLVVAGHTATVFANDTCTAATAIPSLPFTITLDTTTATTDPSDPVLSCTGSQGFKSVWFTYTAGRATTLEIDTLGSDYDIAVSVYTGGCAALSEIACAYDHDFDSTTKLITPVAAGQTVHVLVHGDNGYAGGNLVLNVAKAPYDATPPVSLRAAVAAGDPTPIGGGFARFTRALALSKTDVAFTGTTEGIFVHDGAGVTTIAVSGDPSPVGGTYAELGQPAGGAGGTVAFWSSINAGSADAGIFMHSGGSTTPIVVIGDPAPEGGSFRRFARGIAISPNGALVAFIANTTLSTSRSLYVGAIGGGIQPLLSEDVDLSPCGGFVTSLSLSHTPAINDNGDIALIVGSSGGRDGVLHWAGDWGAVACEDAPTPIGGTYGGIGRNVRIDNLANVAFIASVRLPGLDTEAVFLGNPFGVFVVAQENDLTTGGETILDFSSTGVADVSDWGAGGPGEVAFRARTSAGDAILTRSLMAPLPTAVVTEGQPCPAGGVFTGVDTWVGIDTGGGLAFEATCTGGRGIFKIPPGGAPVTVALQSEVTTAGPGFAFGDPTIEGTSIAFEGSRTGVHSIHCDSVGCGPITVLAQPLTAVPGLPGETITVINADILAGQGNLVAFVANLSGTRYGLLAARSGVIELVTADGLTLPGTAVEVVDIAWWAVPAPVGADKRGVGFAIEIFDPADPEATTGLYLARSGVITEIARAGQMAPNGEFYYGFFDAPLVKGSRVFFRTETDFGTTCLVGASGATQTNLACDGDPLADPPGSTLSRFEDDAPALGSRGPVFRAAIEGNPTIAECLFATGRSGLAPVACSDDLLPYGGVIGDFATGVLGASQKRVVSFATASDQYISGLYEFSASARVRIARNGLATPLGGTYSMSDPGPSVFGKTVAFVSDIIGGTSQQAVFVAILNR